MSRRRSRGDGGLHWDKTRQRWIATVTVGYDGRGKRVVRRGSGLTKTEAKRKLREVLRDQEDGFVPAAASVTVRQTVEDWLTFGLSGRSPVTVDKYRYLCESHVLPHLGSRRLRELRATEVDEWLRTLSKTLSHRTVAEVKSCLNRAVRRAMARDLVKRNVVELCDPPTGLAGRKSKALTAREADAVLTRTAPDRLHNYIVVSLLTGARTEELRALRWEHVHLEPVVRDGEVAVPAYLEVWRSVRAGGDTKTRKSRRTLALPARCADALRRQRVQQAEDRLAAGETWTDTGLVFTSRVGTAMDPSHVRRDFRRALALVPGLDPDEWTPRELRHSFVSLLSDSGMAIEEISRLVGHSGTSVTEVVYRHQIRPVLQVGAQVMDDLFTTGSADP